MSQTLILGIMLLLSQQLYAQSDSVTWIEQMTDSSAVDEMDETGDGDPPEKFFFLQRPAIDTYTVHERRLPAGYTQSIKNDEAFWYADAEIKKEETPEKKSGRYTPVGQRPWFQTLLWLLIIGGFAAALVMYLSGSSIGLFRRKNKAYTIPPDTGEISEDIFEINYQKEIEKAVSEGNYRLAVRLMFLRLLKNMSEKNIINYKQDKTNFDYLLQLHRTRYYEDFFRITRNYEYSWYGQFEVSEHAYRIIRREFEQFENTIR